MMKRALLAVLLLLAWPAAAQNIIYGTAGSPDPHTLTIQGISGGTGVTVVQATGTNLHFVCDSGCSSSTAPADESAFTAGTTPQSPIGGFFQTTATNNALTTGQMGAFQVTANRALFTNLRNASGTELATAGAPLRTDPTGTTTQPVSGTVSATQGTSPWVGNTSQWGGNNVVTGGTNGSVGVGGLAASGAAQAGNPVKIGGVFNTTQPTVTTGQAVDAQATARGAQIVATGVDTFNVTVNAALPAGGNTLGAVTQASGPWSVNHTQLNGVALGSPSNYGTSPGAVSVPGVNAFITNTPAVTLTSTTVTNDLTMQGDVASASADSGNPVKIGGVVQTALPTAGANGNRFNAAVDKFGRQVVIGSDRALETACPSITLTTTTETTLCTAGGAGVFLDLKAISCSNTSATLVRVDVRDATAGTVRLSRALAASGGGFVQVFPDMPWPQAAANNNWTVQLSGAVTDVRCDALAMQDK